MKRKTKKIDKPLFENHLFGDDLVFLLLKLSDHPEGNPGIIPSSQLRKLRFRKLRWESCLNFLLLLERDIGLKVRLVEKDFPEIETTKKSTEAIQKELAKHLKSFIAGKLISADENYFKFDKQENYFIEKIKKKMKSGISKTLFINDNEIGEGYRFFESILILEQQKYLEIKAIYNLQKPENNNFYRITFEVKDKLLEKMGLKEKPKRRLSLKCFSRGNTGYFQIKKSSQETKIGNANSRHFLFLKFLVEKGIDEIVSFDETYKAIKDGKHYTQKSYSDVESGAIKNATKALQKENKIKPLKIIVDKKARTVRLN